VVPFRRTEADDLAVVAKAIHIFRRVLDRMTVLDAVTLTDESWRLRAIADRHVERGVGSFEIFLHQERRSVMSGSRVIESIGGRIERQLLFQTDLHAQQIADGVFVFDAVQTPKHDAPLSGTRGCFSSRDSW